MEIVEEQRQNTKAENKNQFIVIFILTAVISFALGYYFAKSSGTSGELKVVTEEDYKQMVIEEGASGYFKIQDDDVVKGDGDIILVEYSDYFCPFCARFHQVAQRAIDEGEITWVYRHLPFKQGSDYPAVITQCIQEIDSSVAFDYVDLVFSTQGLNESIANSLALGLGLKESDIEECLKEGSSAREKVSKDYKEGGVDLGITGTPTSFLFNKKNNKVKAVYGAVNYETLIQYINSIK